jgi:hypothetical protein
LQAFYDTPKNRWRQFHGPKVKIVEKGNAFPEKHKLGKVSNTDQNLS